MGIFYKKFSIEETKEKEYKIIESVGNYNVMAEVADYSRKSVMTVYNRKEAEMFVKRWNKEKGVRN